MIAFEKLGGPYGIPVYVQEMGDSVRSVSITWLLFVGSVDDTAHGAPGLHHWFEHVPFRGTKSYPNGSKDTKGPLTKWAGKNGAATGQFATRYWAHVPSSVWKLGFDITTSLWCEPLLTDSSIEAERRIIGEEITGYLSGASNHASYHSHSILWPGSPLGHPVLGSVESLASMTPDMLRETHKKSYDSSRTVLIVSGHIKKGEVMDYLESRLAILPCRGLSERRRPVSVGSVPWIPSGTYCQSTSFPSSVVTVLFPAPRAEWVKSAALTCLIANLFDMGGSASVLYRVLREERKLVYGVTSSAILCPGYGAIGFQAESRSQNIEEIVEGIYRIVSDPEVRSSERIQEVKSYWKASRDMREYDPVNYSNIARNRLLTYGDLLSDADIDAVTDQISSRDVEEFFEYMLVQKSRTLIFKGT